MLRQPPHQLPIRPRACMYVCACVRLPYHAVRAFWMLFCISDSKFDGVDRLGLVVCSSKDSDSLLVAMIVLLVLLVAITGTDTIRVCVSARARV